MKPLTSDQEEAIRAPYRQKINDLNYQIRLLQEQRADLVTALERSSIALVDPLQEMRRYQLLDPQCHRLKLAYKEAERVLFSVGPIQAVTHREGPGYFERFTFSGRPDKEIPS